MSWHSLDKITYGKTDNGEFEVVLYTQRYKDKGRRLALCMHEDDAADIVLALHYAHKEGIV